MNTAKASIQNIPIGNQQISLYVPDPLSVKQHYQQNPAEFPYWSQIWPAALGLCNFLYKNADFIKNRTVLELAAGLGLPSLFAAGYCRSVIMSDYIPEAVQLMKESILLNQLENASAELLDWNDLPASTQAKVLLLSDINYEPEAFASVFKVIVQFINNGSTIILSTPQRLMGKPFIERLLPFTVQQEEVMIEKNGVITPVTVLVLKS